MRAIKSATGAIPRREAKKRRNPRIQLRFGGHNLRVFRERICRRRTRA